MTTCAFHAYTGTDPCPYCIEAGASVNNKSALAFDQSTKSYRVPGRQAWVDDCPNCASVDLRIYEGEAGSYVWCGTCGARNLESEPNHEPT